MRLLYFGMNGAFSYLPLAAILQAQRTGQYDWLQVAAVVLPASAVPHVQLDGPIEGLPPERPQSELPLLQPYMEATIIHLAWANDIPVFLVNGLKAAEIGSRLSALEPDVACAACFPYRIPPGILAVPQNGFLNIHPSLLPAYRGPSPLFWIFRDGRQEETGVTVHWMDAGLDSGDILSQRPFSLRDGISGPEADRLAATIGGEMLVAGLAGIRAGEGPRRPQPAGGSYQAWPTADAFELDLSWSARRAFNFMRGTAEWNTAYTLKIGERLLRLRTAEAFDPNQRLDQPVDEVDGLFRIQFAPGVLTAVGTAQVPGTSRRGG
jgi:methionyl-tRNA formyltransferase